MRRFLWLLTAACALGQTPAPPPPTAPDRLTLQDAEAQAIKNHPQVSAALLNAAAKGLLATPAGVEKETRRLLASEKARDAWDGARRAFRGCQKAFSGA